jgi:hypothetical protein
MFSSCKFVSLSPRLRLAISVFAVLFANLALSKTAGAQNDPPVPVNVSSSVDTAEAAQHQQPMMDTVISQDGDSDTASSSDDESDEEQDPDTDLSSGLPLKILLTPFHWGRFSLLSVNAYEGYNSNPQFQRIPLGAEITSISPLAIYSTEVSGWKANFQYQPFIWLSSKRTLKDFAAVSFDVRTVRHINGNWHWTLGDRLRFSPTHSTEQSKGFVADPSGGFSIGDAFLSSGRNVLVNGVVSTLTDRYGENSSLTFHADQDYTHLSSFVGGLEAIDTLPAQRALTFSTGATWRKSISMKDTLSAEYTYRFLNTGTSGADVNSQAASIGLSHKFTQSLGVSATAGPAWSLYSGHDNRSSHGRATLHGSLALSKEFKRGGVILSFARSDSFTGIISDGFHNRYDLNLHREFTTRFHGSISGSYIQQEFSNAHNTNGELASGELRYLLDRNWAIFAQARYLNIWGNARILGPEKSVILGFRWSWVPEKPEI